jgi:periplasmic divalent cation tolerance protein
MKQHADALAIGWTTIADPKQADELASALISTKLACCVQVDGPVQSHFFWENRVEHSEEFRLTIKFPLQNAEALNDWINCHHPYECPEWIWIKADGVAPAYAKWAVQQSLNSPGNS